jgi:fibronectin-binding autotransporter adhesin
LTVNLLDLTGTAAGIVTNDGASGATLVLSNELATSFAGIIRDGASPITLYTGGAELTLTGNSTYSGTTNIDNTLQVGNGGTSGTLGSGSVILSENATLAFNRSDAFTVANTIDGFGGLSKLGAGTLTLTGNNAYSGGTNITEGAIRITNASAVGTWYATIQGGTLFADFDGAFSPGLIFGAEGGTVAAAAGRTVSLNGSLDAENGATARFGQTSHAGTIVLNNYGVGGAGFLNLLSIDGGTVRIGNVFISFGLNYLLGPTGSFAIEAEATLDVSGFSMKLNRLTGAGTVANTGGHSLVTLVDAQTFNGTIDTGANGITLTGGLGGTSSLTKIRSGILGLTGSKSYTGGTTVNAGTLALGNASFGEIDAAGTGTITLNGGNLVSAVTGNLTNRIEIASGNSATIGATAGNTLSIASLSLLGGSEPTLTFGSSTLTGRVELNSGVRSPSDYGIAIAGGTLSGGSGLQAHLQFLVNRVTVGTDVTTATLDASGQSLVLRNLSGSSAGRITNSGSSSSTLNTANTYDTTFAGTIGDGVGLTSVDKSGDGTLTLTGANSYTGGTVLTAGGLVVNGSLASGVTVNGGTLGGSGSIAGLVTVNGGTLAAGNSPGTLTMGALALNAGSTITFELGEAGVAGGASNDLIRVTGDLALNGGTIQIDRGAGFGAGQYTLFEYGSLTGALGNMTLSPLGGGYVGGLALGEGTVLLNTATAAELVYWNGSTTSPTGALVGGDGIWSQAGGNFTRLAGDVSGPWAGDGNLAVFGGTGGEVVIAAGEVLSPAGMNFLTDGYVIQAGDSASQLALSGPTSIVTETGATASIRAVISGTGSLTKTGQGALVLSGANTYTGDTTVLQGTLANKNVIAGNVLSLATFINGGTVSGSLTVAGGTAINLESGSVAGLTTIDPSGELANEGTLASVYVAGTLASEGSITGTVTNFGTVSNLGSIGGGLVNAGTASNHGTVQGGAGNSGTIENTGTINGPIDNSGVLLSSGTLTGALTNRAGGIVTLAGVLDGSVGNSGTITLTGTTTGIGALVQDTQGEFDLAGFDTTIGSLAGDGSVLLGTATLTVGSSNETTTFDGAIFGSGGLVKTGEGNLTLTGVNAFTGDTRIDSGSLILGAAGEVAGQVRNSDYFENAGIVKGRLINARNAVSTGTIEGGLSVLGGSTTDLAGTVNGTIESTGNILLIGDLSSNGTAVMSEGAITRVDVGTTWTGLTGFTNSSASILGLYIDGTLVVDGTVTNSVDATTNVVSGGTLTAHKIANQGKVDNAGTLNGAITSGGTLINSGTINGTVTNAGVLASTGTLAGNLINRTGGTVSLAGTLDGDIENRGTITLTGVTNGITSYTQQDGSLDLAGFDTALGDLAGNGSVQLGSATLTIGGNGASTSFDGVISGTGPVVKTGSGTLTLTGANTYSGGTWIAAGTLALGADGVLAGAVTNSATFANAGTVNGAIANAGTLASTGTVDGDLDNAAGATASLAGQVNGDVTNAGAITLTGTTTGIASLVQETTGTFDLGGFATTLGSLGGSGAVALGSGELIAGSNGADTRFDGVIAGSGGLTKVGSGSLVLGGANSFTGITTIDAGALGLAAGATLAGAVTNAATFSNAGTVAGHATNNAELVSSGALEGGLTNASGASAMLAGSIGGSFGNAGTIVVASGTSLAASTLANTGQVLNAGTWTGGMANSAGAMVENTATGTIEGAFDNQGILLSAGTLVGRLANGGAARIAGTVTGAIVNSGEVLANGNVLHTGEVSSSGLFTVGAGTFATSGTFANSGSLGVTSGATLALGTATLRSSGAGALIDVAGTVRGRIDLVGGALIGRAGSLLDGDLTVAAGATFMGGGTVRGNVAVNGTLLPGNSPGTLAVNGTLALGGSSTTVFEMTDAASDRIVVNGTASIATGATLVLSGVRAATPGQPYSLISTTGGIVGSFTNIVKDPRVFGFVRQDADSIDLLGTLTLPATITGQGAATVNYLNERLLAGTVTSAGYDLAQAVASLDGTPILPVIARLNPEPYASAATMALENGLVLAKTVRAAGMAGVDMAGVDEDDGGLFVFGQGFAAGRDLAARPTGVAAAAQAGEGFLGGVGYGTTAFGVSAFVGRSSVRQEIAGLGAQTRSRGIFFGGKLQAATGGLRLAASAIFDRSDANTGRAPLTGATMGRYALHGETFDAELAYDLPIGNGGLSLRPSAGLTHSRVTRGAVAETGGGAAALKVMRQSYQATWINGEIALRAASTGKVQPWVGLGVRHLANGDPIRATGTLAGFGGQFTVEGNQAPRTFVHASGGLSGTIAPGLSAHLAGEVDAASKGGARQIQAGIRYAF